MCKVEVRNRIVEMLSCPEYTPRLSGKDTRKRVARRKCSVAQSRNALHAFRRNPYMSLDEVVKILPRRVVASSVNFPSATAKVVIVKDKKRKELSGKEKKTIGTAKRISARWKKNQSHVLRVSKGRLAPLLQEECGREEQSIVAAKSASMLPAKAAVTITRQHSDRSEGTILVEMARSGSVLRASRP